MNWPEMMARTRRLSILDHLVGAACAIALMCWSSDIATFVSISLSMLLEGAMDGGRLYFVGEFQTSTLGAIAGVVVLGLIVATADWLVASGYVRGWTPPLAMLSVVTGVFLVLYRVGGMAGNEAAVLSATLGTLAVLALVSYWGGALVVGVLRRRTLSGFGHAG